jgi:hypothetical protein
MKKYNLDIVKKKHIKYHIPSEVLQYLEFYELPEDLNTIGEFSNNLCSYVITKRPWDNLTTLNITDNQYMYEISPELIECYEFDGMEDSSYTERIYTYAISITSSLVNVLSYSVIPQYSHAHSGQGKSWAYDSSTQYYNIQYKEGLSVIRD